MTHDELIFLAGKAGFLQHMGVIAVPNLDNLKRFAELVTSFDPVRAERERERKQAIERMAEEAGWGTASDRDLDLCHYCGLFDLERFAELVASDEREACANECDEWIKNGSTLAEDIATAIRARGEK